MVLMKYSEFFLIYGILSFLRSTDKVVYLGTLFSPPVSLRTGIRDWGKRRRACSATSVPRDHRVETAYFLAPEG